MSEGSNVAGDGAAAWYDGWTEGQDALFAGGVTAPADGPAYRTLTYEVTGRIARITFNRPEQGNAITLDTPFELAAAVERADLDPAVHVIVVSGNGPGFCGGYDLSVFAEGDFSDGAGAASPYAGTMLDPAVQARNHDPEQTWDPMLDYA